jgi:hypothetical protein
MHPMFAELFLPADAIEQLAADEDRRRNASRAPRARLAARTMPAQGTGTVRSARAR